MTAIPPSQYQSFEPGAGSSDSFGKLAALKLPDMKGKRFLDLGCNHGFFCFAALEKGAEEVVGVDRDPKAIEAAAARAEAKGVTQSARFINKSWDQFDEGGFDVIILLSALHYAKDQLAFLDKIAGMLKPDGMLILEGGVIKNPKRNWTSIIRGKPPHTDMVEYPDPTFFFDALSKNFAPRELGRSVIQPGDNIPRFVWHCRKLARMVDIVVAPSGRGKTTFAFSLKRKGVPVVDVEHLILEEHWRQQKTAIGKSIEPVFVDGRLDKCIAKINEDGLFDELVSLTWDKINSYPLSEAPTVVVMSVVFEDPIFRGLFDQAAKENGAIVWVTRRSV